MQKSLTPLTFRYFLISNPEKKHHFEHNNVDVVRERRLKITECEYRRMANSNPELDSYEARELAISNIYQPQCRAWADSLSIAEVHAEFEKRFPDVRPITLDEYKEFLKNNYN